MKKRCKNSEEKNLLPFHIIKAASEGDVMAINTVLKHYEGYIITLSTRKMYDEGGRLHFCVDETLRRRLETKLITKINGEDQEFTQPLQEGDEIELYWEK